MAGMIARFFLLLLAALPQFVLADELTLEQIMADPDWLGNQPEDAFWGHDNRTVYFRQKRQGSELRDLYSVDTRNGAVAEVAEASWSAFDRGSAVYSEGGDLHTWEYAGDIFLGDGESLRQVTRTAATESDPWFMADGRRVAFQRDRQFFVFDPATGLVEQLTDTRFEKDPYDEGDFDVLEAHQKRLYEQLRKAESDAEEARERAKSLYELDANLPPAPVYFGDEVELEGQSLSPAGRWLVVVTSKKDFAAGKHGTMPNYVTASGHVETREVRTRVGRNGYAPHSVWLVDLASGEKHELDPGDLPGIREDPLADLRKSAIEYFVNAGEDREKAEKRLKAPEVRPVMVWSTTWSPDGENVALYIRAIDNKDRWIATLDVEEKNLVSQHRLSDEAWVNSYHIEHGWLKDNRTLWFLSEDHGYLGIYTKKVGARRARALVVGEHVVFDPQLGPSGKYLYYRANIEHPGVYEIWRVNVESGAAEQLTSLDGMKFVAVSPDESKLQITQ